MSDCDIDDIMCQLKILDSLRVIKDATDEDRFKERYPELANMGDVLASRITEQDSLLRSAFEKCNIPVPSSLEITAGLEEEDDI